MSKSNTIYECSNCDAQFPKWTGRCSVCGKWNTIDKAKDQISNVKNFKAYQSAKPVFFKDIKGNNFFRIKTDIAEFDRVMGGGIVPGSVTLIGGDPGIGKSTLVLQIASKISGKNNVIYISGEESQDQVKLRASRLKIKYDNLQFLSETDINTICATIAKLKPQIVIIDSIQTMYDSEIPQGAGSINQVRICTNKLVQTAKSSNVSIFIIGHVTKEGAVAGPRTLEHLVDTVLYLEGERYHAYRILRGVKNRFGSTNEAGVFEMKDVGLEEVKDPSGIFLEERKEGFPGQCVTATFEGTRPFLIEIQALTSFTNFGYPKRTSSGIDLNKLQLLCAVLTKRARLKLDGQDVYLNITGGFKIKDPGIDLAICIAIASSFLNKEVDPKTIVLGEVGLSGELRSVNNVEKRIKEAEKLGFKKVILPDSKNAKDFRNIKLIKVSNVIDSIQKIFK